MWIALALLAVPFIEIALFIRVGGLIGLWPTIALVIAMAVAGGILLRSQGLRTLRSLQEQMVRGGDPSTPLVDGALILLAAVLLMTPGFFTDAVGLVLMVPPVRAAVAAWLRPRLTGRVVTFGTAGFGSRGEASGGFASGNFGLAGSRSGSQPDRRRQSGFDTPIDAEYREVPTDPGRRAPPRD